ncbi:MAG: hypothetical protein ACIAQF_08665 [Phycisphaerales bacterium JB065]
MRIRTIAVLLLAGSCLTASTIATVATAPDSSQPPQRDIDAREEAVQSWLRSLPLPGFIDQLPEEGLSEDQARVLAALKHEPEFEQFLREVPNTGRVYFGRYFAWQIRNVKSEAAADAPVFVHTIMNDLARLKSFSEQEIVRIRLERERQYRSLLNVARSRLKQELESYDLSEETIDAVLETFDRSAAETGSWLTNPACAYCDAPASPEAAQRMLRYQEKNQEKVAKIINEVMNKPLSEVWQLSRLKAAAAQIEFAVANDFVSRMAWRDTPEVENPDSPARRVLQPGPYAIFFPVEWDRFSYWKATGPHEVASAMASGGIENPEPFRVVVVRYKPDTEDPDRQREPDPRTPRNSDG